MAFGTFLEAGGGPASPRDLALGRRCVRLAPGQAVEVELPVPGRSLEGVAGLPGAVRIRNLSIAGLQRSASSPVPQGEVPQTPRAPESASPPAAGPDLPSGAAAQFGCASAPEGAARRACTAGYLAASARAAARTGAFAGTTRACLTEYAALQERAAERIRAGDPAGEVLADEVPACFSPASARWDFAMLERLCPEGRWTPANQGRVACGTPGLAALEEVAGPAAPPTDTLPATPAPAAASQASPSAPSQGGAAGPAREEIDLQRILRLLFGTILAIAGIGLLVPLVQALALLLVLVPAALLRRAIGSPEPGGRRRPA